MGDGYMDVFTLRKHILQLWHVYCACVCVYIIYNTSIKFSKVKWHNAFTTEQSSYSTNIYWMEEIKLNVVLSNKKLFLNIEFYIFSPPIMNLFN